jgi:hypothetical protein
MSNPIYTPITNSVLLDTGGQKHELITCNSNYGTIIRQVVVQANGNITAGKIKFYLKVDETNWRLFREVPVPEVIQTNQYPAFSTVLSFNNIIIANQDVLGVETVNSEEFVISVFGLEISSYS